MLALLPLGQKRACECLGRSFVAERAQSIQHSAFSIQRGARSEVPGARWALGSEVSSEGRLLARAPSSLP